MKQGKGTDVLGANDPRSEAIGVIYVSPNDDRKSVLAAILTQEKLGRKQVAVVLPPTQNKAFQRPGDFDDLKTMRRKLQTQVVFIAPSGPGPAEFARQRRFLVYSSLESYAKALRDEIQVESATKKSWLFGSPRAKADGGSTPSNGAQELDTPVNGRASSFEDDEHEHNGSPLLPFAAGAGTAIAANAAFNAHSQNTSPTATPPQDFADDADDLGPLPAAPARTPVPADLYGQTQAMPPSRAAADPTTDGGSIIELRSRRSSKATLPLSPREPDPVPVAPVVVPESDSTTTLPRPRRSTGKMAAAVGTGAAAGAVAAVAATPTRAGTQGRASAAAGAGAVAPRPGNPGGIPPHSTPPGGGGRGNGRSPRSRGGWIVLALVALVIALLACGGLMAYAQPKSLPGQIAHGLISQPQSPASITITPSSQTIQDTYTLVGATKTNPTSRQVAVHIITGAAQSAATPVKATGRAQHNAKAATGLITFFNNTPAAQQVNGGTSFNVGGGVSLMTDGPAYIPAGNGFQNGHFAVAAHAVPAGRAGNVGSYVLNVTPCCATGISVSNTAAFTGGLDAVNYTFLQQSDVNNAISQSIKDVTKQDSLNDLKRQMGTGEQLLGPTHCTPTLRADQQIGDQGTNVNSANVSYLMKCTATTYDNQGAQNIVKDLLTQKATSTLAPGYVLANNIQTSLTNQTTTKNIVSFFFSGKGIWAYQFTDAQKLQLAKSIAGKTVAAAQNILKNTTGVGNAVINVNGGNTLPTDYNQISIVIQPIAGLGGGGTPSPGSSPTVTNPTVQSGTPGANGKGGSSNGGS
ncbi:MAG: hypothetical protein H0V70_22255 [Ktedonobacteraceae bacterium]|nr:hypothetical protein [Ktedonobacteraceae bacterium]